MGLTTLAERIISGVLTETFQIMEGDLLRKEPVQTIKISSEHLCQLSVGIFVSFCLFSF